MSGGSAVLIRHFFPERFEYSLQVTGASDDHACVDDTQIEEETEVVQVAVKERVLVVPFDFQSNALFEAIHFVSRRVPFLRINAYPGREFFSFQPLSSRKVSMRLAMTLLRPPPFK